MVIWANEVEELHIPQWVHDIHAYRRWTERTDFPEHGQISWICGEVWIDMGKEQLFTHVLVKTEITSVLRQLTKTENLGFVFGDGLMLTNFAADISVNPDATFVSHATLQSDRVRLIEGHEGGFTELQGSPDMVLEVVSRSSFRKDSVVLKRAYWEAGVREYWLIDARRPAIRFDIFRRGPKGFTATRRRDGWLRSDVFARSFRLTATETTTGHPEFRLETR